MSVEMDYITEGNKEYGILRSFPSSTEPLWVALQCYKVCRYLLVGALNMLRPYLTMLSNSIKLEDVYSVLDDDIGLSEEAFSYLNKITKFKYNTDMGISQCITFEDSAMCKTVVEELHYKVNIVCDVHTVTE